MIESTYQHFYSMTQDATAAALLTLAEAIGGQKPAADAKPAELTPPVVAERYGVSPDTVRLWIESGRLTAKNVARPGRRPRYRISEAALIEFDRTSRVERPTTRRKIKLA
jgi:excisionase family DNA binding protein